VINRLRLIRNVGQFDSVAAGGQFPLARLTLVYAENGRGKTTRAAVLRSLASGDPIPITERHRLAANNPAHVILDCGGGPPAAIFENGAWNRRLPQVTIFDDTFVDENVYSGLGVEPDHRQHLHELILGAQGVSLNQELHRLVAKIEAHNAALRTKVAAIPAADRGRLTVDEFCGLQASAAIDEEIQAADRRLMAARAQAAIRDTPGFDPLGLPAFDIGAIERVLQADLPTLDTTAVASLRTHLAALNQGAEAWIAEGVRLAPPPVEGQPPGTCPFCEQDLAGSPVIDHYRAYFSDAYGALKRTVADALAILNHGHAGEEPASFERAVRARAGISWTKRSVAARLAVWRSRQRWWARCSVGSPPCGRI